MESHGEPDRIQVTEATYWVLRDSYAFSAPREVQIKGKGPMTVYFLTEPISPVADVTIHTAASDR